MQKSRVLFSHASKKCLSSHSLWFIAAEKLKYKYKPEFHVLCHYDVKANSQSRNQVVKSKLWWGESKVLFLPSLTNALLPDVISLCFLWFAVHRQAESGDYRDGAGGAGQESQKAAGRAAGFRGLCPVPQPASYRHAHTSPQPLWPGKHRHSLLQASPWTDSKITN